MHPYDKLPDCSFWRKSVSAQSWAELAFKPETKFKLKPADRIATAGSCFAQHMARRLPTFGLAHHVVETAPAFMSAERASALQYGVFSARYANVYTVRQLRQLIEYAFGLRPEASPTCQHEGRWYDLLRPRITPGGYTSHDDLMADRRYHLGAVRRMFLGCDVFVFTLGLTEAWVEAESAIAFPVCPGTAVGEFDAAQHAFVNFKHASILDDLNWCVGQLHSVNPALRWILTVSPVPLVATATGHPVLTASSYSKAVLRAVAGDVADAHAQVEYFPSFEIIASAQSFGQYLASDLREVSPRGVNHVMREFAGSFVEGAQGPAPQIGRAAVAEPARADASLHAQMAQAAQVECEELLNDRP